MKNILLLAYLFLCVTPISLAAQSEEAVPILAVQLTEEAAEPYFKKYKLPGITVDDAGVLRPAAGYDMYLIPEKEQFVVKPVKTPIQSTEEYEAKNVPGGTMFCLCASANDDCSIAPVVHDNTISYYCGGSCACGSFTIFDTSPISTIRFQSASGDWRDFDKG